jgi:transposase
MKIIRVGIDLAKNVFQIHGVDRSEKTVWRCKVGRQNFSEHCSAR